MSRKDYQLIATALGRGVIKADDKQSAREVAKAVAIDLHTANSRFDYDRFMDWVDEVVRGDRNEWTGAKQAHTGTVAA